MTSSVQMKILRWLIDNPGWHFGKEIATATDTSDVMVYTRLDHLEQWQFIERRDEPGQMPLPGMFPRHQFRSRLTHAVGAESK